ncbi:MAG: hypothetical protein KDD40_07790, partial [Bdellovibrionales bacterium]|nr:hypothetical protein [Bdellovibrionales bacterium]
RKYARAINDLNIDELATRYNIDPTFITKIIQSFPSSYELDYIEGRKTSREFLTPVAMLMFAGVFGYYPLQEISEAYALQYPLVQFLEDSEKAMQIDIRQSRVAVAYSTRLFNDYDNVADLAQYIPSLNKFREQSKDYNFAKVSNPVALAQFIEKNKDVDLLIIMAHGEQDNFMLSPGQELIDVNLSQLSPLKPGANLIYISCALGKNAESRDLTKTNWINLAEVILPDGIAIASNQIISLGEVVPASTFQAVSNAYEKYTRNILMNPAGSALGIAQIQTAIEMWPLLNPFFNSEITELKVYHTGTNQLISIPISNTESSDETTSALND